MKEGPLFKWIILSVLQEQILINNNLSDTAIFDPIWTGWGDNSSGNKAAEQVNGQLKPYYLAFVLV